jgi:transposase
MGRKHHLFVDTEGLVIKAFVTEANYHDGTVASWLVGSVARACPRLAKIWADKNYRGLFVDAAKLLHIDVEIVCGQPGQVGFQVQPRRWVVERTFAWLSNYRRLSKDYEQWVSTSDAMIYASMSHLMLRRLARLRSQKQLLE